MIDDETRTKIKDHYNRGEGSIQDIARVYRVSVADVLDITNNQELKAVTIQGDLIDPQEAMGHGSQFNPGTVVNQNYDLN